MNTKISVIEDDIQTSELIKDALTKQGFIVSTYFDGESGLYALLENHFDLAIVDIMLPKLDGISLIKKVKLEKPDFPVIILSAKSEIEDRVSGLEYGADDYLTKPFEIIELIARIKSLLRRLKASDKATKIEYEGITIDIEAQKVWREGKKIFLSKQEFKFLLYLMKNKEEIISKSRIQKEVLDYNFDPQTNIVEKNICCLRNKIDKGFTIKLLHTIRGIGYVLKKKN
jgi:two-component system OmpR family response regulator